MTFSSSQLQVGGQLGHRRAPAELAFEATAGLGDPGEQVAGVHRQAHRAAGVGDTPGDGLADPPGGVGRELEALAPVELLDRVHQAEVALLDQVEQGQFGRLVLLGDGNDQTEVGLDEGLGRVVAASDQPPQLPLAGRGDRLGRGQLGSCLPSCLDGLGQPGFVVLGQQRVLADVVQVEAYQVLFGLSRVIGGHLRSNVLPMRRPAGVAVFPPPNANTLARPSKT